MIYTAGTRALACLENIVHRSSLGLLEKFRIMMIEIPDDIVMKEVKPAALSDDWRKFDNYPETQGIGDGWIKKAESAVLKAPSAIIPEEFNYLINPLHKDFDRIKYLRNDPFTFDSRIKG
jgi:RES domain-containing protein